jgi:threonine aldolase
VGSVLCGSRALIARARRWRKVVGGGMRQAGVLAAAIDHALDHHVQRLRDDHARAARLADGLRGLPGLTVRSAATNIVFVDVDGGRGAELLAHLAARGILATGLIGLRFVTHLDVDDDGIERTVAAVREFCERPASAATAAAPRAPY